ncbi:MAG: hypothetical protein IJ677_05400 [Alphaproteobacteria bacterium]|nr:hypothetical protein [Alphaproteobacteria bacterium]
MLKSIKYLTLATVILASCYANYAKAQTTTPHSKILILKIAEQPQQIVAGNHSSSNDGVWEDTKEVTSDVWDGTKTVTEDVWDGAKKAGSDIKSGLSDSTDSKNATDNNNIQQ